MKLSEISKAPEAMRCKIHPDVLASLVGVPEHLADHWAALCWEAARYRRITERFKLLDVVPRLRTEARILSELANEIEALTQNDEHE